MESEVEALRAEVARLKEELIASMMSHAAAESRLDMYRAAMARCASQFNTGVAVVCCAVRGIHTTHTNIPDPSEEELKFTYTWSDDGCGVVRPHFS